MALNEGLLKTNKSRFDELNITYAQNNGLTGKGVKIGIIGFSPKSHHNGAWLIQQVIPDAKIIEYNVMDAETTKFSWMETFQKMIDDGVQVVCCSLQKRIWGEDLKSITKLMYDKNIIMIDSSDNDSKEIHSYPALDKHWFVIGVCDGKGRASYSNYGDNLLGLGYSNYASINKSGDYVPISHTSGAVQVICGIAGMLKQINPNLSPSEFKEFISKHSIRLSSYDWNKYEGYGLISLPEVIEFNNVIIPKEEDDMSFKDTNGHWAEQYIDYVVTKGYMNGKSADTFEPNTTLTRAELATVLARKDGFVPVKK